MSQNVDNDYSIIQKIAGTLEQLDKIQNEIGKEKADANPNANYDMVERRPVMPFDHAQEWYGKEPTVPSVKDANQYEDAPQTYADATKGASGTNKRFMYPSGKGKSAKYVRKSTYGKLKKAGLGQ